MRQSELNALLAFSDIVESGSIARAALRRNVTPSALSQSLQTLEKRVGVPLLYRTTRKNQPTAAGLRLAERVRRAMVEIEAAVRDTGSDNSVELLRITVSNVAADLLIAPCAALLPARLPRLRLDVSVNDRLVDIVGEGFDAGIRRGDKLQPGMVELLLSPDADMMVVAAPSYLDGKKIPSGPDDLEHYQCIRIGSLTDKAIRPWHFQHNGSEDDIRTDGALCVDSTHLALEAALDGAGLAYLASDYLAPHLNSGRLVPLLQGWSFHRRGFVLFAKQQSEAMRLVRLLWPILRLHGATSSSPSDPAVLGPVAL